MPGGRLPGRWARGAARRRYRGVALVGVAAVACLALSACDRGTGYVEIKIVPSTAVRSPRLLLDSAQLEPIKDGQAILTAPVGTHKLQMEWVGGQNTVLCEIEVKKDRITTLTLSALDRPPRCQCRRSAGDAKGRPQTCVS